MKIRIGKLWFPVLTLGYGRRLGIWVQGCERRCRGCISPELRPPGEGTEYPVEDLITLAQSYGDSIDGVTISGGEPFDQPEALALLVDGFRKAGIEDILVFTGYTREELLHSRSDSVGHILSEIAILIDGPYIEKMNSGRGLRGSDNQRIWIRRYAERYADSETCARKMQCVLLEQELWMIGIPPEP